jgi:hypothetical protein
LLAGFNPVNVLKSNRTHRFNPALSRGLVVVQYAMCLFLITAALVMYRQMQYVLRKDLGFDQDRVLVVENPERTRSGRNCSGNACSSTPPGPESRGWRAPAPRSARAA